MFSINSFTRDTASNVIFTITGIQQIMFLFSEWKYKLDKKVELFDLHKCFRLKDDEFIQNLKGPFCDEEKRNILCSFIKEKNLWTKCFMKFYFTFKISPKYSVDLLKFYFPYFTKGFNDHDFGIISNWKNNQINLMFCYIMNNSDKKLLKSEFFINLKNKYSKIIRK
jgi:hypothetical protein